MGRSVDFCYSGPRSKRFWNRVNRTEEIHDMYTLGVLLQNLEEYVLAQLLKAEAK